MIKLCCLRQKFDHSTLKFSMVFDLLQFWNFQSFLLFCSLNRLSRNCWTLTKPQSWSSSIRPRTIASSWQISTTGWPQSWNKKQAKMCSSEKNWSKLKEPWIKRYGARLHRCALKRKYPPTVKQSSLQCLQRKSNALNVRYRSKLTHSKVFERKLNKNLNRRPIT